MQSSTHSTSKVSGRGGERSDVQPPVEAGDGEPDPAEDGGGAQRSGQRGRRHKTVKSQPGKPETGPESKQKELVLKCVCVSGWGKTRGPSLKDVSYFLFFSL